MKLGQFISYYIRKNFTKKFYKNCDLKTSSMPFNVCKELSTTSVGKLNFLRNYLYQICNSKTIKIYPNQHAGLLRFLFTEDSLKTMKGLGLVSRSHFSNNFLHWPNFVIRMCLLLQLFSKMRFVFHAWAIDDAMTFEYPKSQNLIYSRTKSFQSDIEDIFPFFTSALLQTYKLSKMQWTQHLK